MKDAPVLEDVAIAANGLTKRYALFNQPSDRLRQMLWSGAARIAHGVGRILQSAGARGAGQKLRAWTAPRYFREFVALQSVDLTVRRGEVLGVVGKNGAGKSTLLQLICGTVEPTEGSVVVRGRVAALLELGAGFNPEFTGRENIGMAAAIMGLSAQETADRMEAIEAFADIGPFIDQPVKTYSSGMYVRLAFAVATSVEPDILIIDEALSVGDGAFARRSFDRIMELKERGATILFCSHAMYHVQALCARAVWLEAGGVRMVGTAAEVTAAYEMSQVATSGGAFATAPAPASALAVSAAEAAEQDLGSAHPAEAASSEEQMDATSSTPAVLDSSLQGTARITGIDVSADGLVGHELAVLSCKTSVTLTVRFASDPALPPPSLAMAFIAASGAPVASAGSANDGVVLKRGTDGRGEAVLTFTRLPLLQGLYTLNVFLLCERGVHVYDHAERCARLVVSQRGLEQGVVRLPHAWGDDGKVEAAEDVPALPSTPSWNLSATPDAVEFFATHEELPLGATVPSPEGLSVAQRAFYASVGARAGWEALPAENSEAAQHSAAHGLSGWQRVREPLWQVRWAHHGAMDQWLELFRESFGHEVNEAQWRWKYRDARPMGCGVWRDGVPVAFYGGMPRPIEFMGTSAMAVQIGDVMVHPQQRGVLTRTGPFFLSTATYLEKMIGVGRPYLVGFGFPSRRHLRLAHKLDLYDEVDQVTELRWPGAEMPADWVLERLDFSAPETGRELDNLWDSMRIELAHFIVPVRNAARWTYRFDKHPARPYEAWWIRRKADSRACAAMVIKRDGAHIELMDWIAPPTLGSEVVACARGLVQEAGADHLMGWYSSSIASLIAGADGVAHAIGVGVPTSTWTPGPDKSTLQGRWWLTGGDTDFR
jgi:lipopolysaccharide transport system ATP-binding protein